MISGADGSPEEGLQLTAVWDGTSGTRTANVAVQQGLASGLDNALSRILNPTTGPLALWTAAADDRIQNMTDNITRMQTRLDDEQDELKAQYARLEATLAEMDRQRAAFSALMGSSSSSSSGSVGVSST
jgi:flagellar capping protein FliD